jgi:hypothetical protein
LSDDSDNKQTKTDGQAKAEKEVKAAREKAEKEAKEASEKAEKKAKEPWDIAFGAALLSDYDFRGISASDHRPAVSVYFEPHYDFSRSLQAYASRLPPATAAAVELFAGARPTFDRLARDFGFWEHWLPGGRCFNVQGPGGLCIPQLTVPFVNSLPGDISFWEVYGRATYHVDRQLSFGGSGLLDAHRSELGRRGDVCGRLGEVRSAADLSKGLRLVHFRRGRSLVPRHEPLPELHELEGRTCLHLEAVHPRSTLL